MILSPAGLARWSSRRPRLVLGLWLATLILAMDYQVFLLSRIRERFTETGDNVAAIAHGIGSTARLITGAALIIVLPKWLGWLPKVSIETPRAS